MFCAKCGTQLPDDAVFCFKCGLKLGAGAPTVSSQNHTEAKDLKCPSCGAAISPKFGEMVITCDYCGGSVSLENKGWQNIQKHTMLAITIPNKDEIIARLRHMMDRGLLHRHLQENSKL